MGEYAEMMLDGTMCSSCGDYLGTDNGFPTQCPSCSREDRREQKQKASGIFLVIRKERDLAGLRDELAGVHFNIASPSVDKANNPMFRLHCDPKPDSDWSKVQRIGTVICQDKALRDKTEQMLIGIMAEREAEIDALLSKGKSNG